MTHFSLKQKRSVIFASFLLLLLQLDTSLEQDEKWNSSVVPGAHCTITASFPHHIFISHSLLCFFFFYNDGVISCLQKNIPRMDFRSKVEKKEKLPQTLFYVPYKLSINQSLCRKTIMITKWNTHMHKEMSSYWYEIKTNCWITTYYVLIYFDNVDI